MIKHPSQIILGNCPSKSNNYRIGKKTLYKEREVKDYERAFILQCKNYRNIFITGKFHFNLKVYFADEKSDLDGSFKVILDCLKQCRAIKDDRYCVKIIAEKFIDKKNPHIVFYITEVS